MAEEDKVITLAQEFATAFASEGGGEGGEGNQAPPPSDPKPGGDGEDPDAPPDLFAEADLDTLLRHPKLGPALNSWADKAAANQVKAALERERAQGKVEGRQEAEAESRNRFFAELSKDKDELAKELAADDGLAAEYAGWRAEQQERSSGSEEAAAAAQVYALAVEIQTVQSIIAKSGLPDDVKAKPELNPETYRGQGAAGIAAWRTAVTEAITAQKAEQLASGIAEERAEARVQERLAELDASRPGGLAVGGGRKAPPADLYKTPARVLAQQAWAQ